MALLEGISDETRLVVSEPLGDLPGAWNEVPESSYGIVQPGADELLPFTPQPVDQVGVKVVHGSNPAGRRP
jgi:glutamine amidotransferase